MTRTIVAAALAVACALSPGALSANSLVAAGPQAGIARSRLSATTSGEWNRLKRIDGRNIEVWTADGDALNKITFYGGIPAGRPLVRETDRRNRPLPRVSATMLPTDIPTLLEATYRSAGTVSQMSIGAQAPAMLGGRRAIRFTYEMTTTEDEVRRRGEAIAALVDGQLYLVTYEAPALHFFDRDVARYREIVASLKL